ncbi:DUF4139 domain-containing protein [Flammeovirga aprica]|uniref:Mucoidy inhibitor MuiA family protein n=1 Tax=Flammeovirga aprica JL-4 TaxID=694437 RepID=A0A7X9RXY4_9BACT|nr:DUF4139 domain-containing protein [Flammeovirga aprica]NME70776.1 mucoidy inhibitor MuiA family protein [Flammeovirga aprica JL-4]
MKKYITLFLIIFYLPLFTSANDQIEVSSKINNVTVYTNSASVERSASVNVPQGKSVLVFKKLSHQIVTNTIQFQTKGVRVLSIDSEYDKVELRDNKAYSELKSKIDQLKEKVFEKETYLEILNKDLELLEANKTISSSNLNLSELKSALAFFHDKRLQVEKEKSTYQKEVIVLKLEIEKLNKELSMISRDHISHYNNVMVTIQSDKAKSIDYLLKYIVNQVGWTPTYDILATDINSPFNVVFKANIYQRSGVDWNDVSISISSGAPSERNRLPKLNPKYLDLVALQQNRMVQQSAKVYSAPSYKKSSQDNWGAVEVEEEEVEEEIATSLSWVLNQSSYQTQFTYQINQKYSIPNNTRKKAIELKTEKIDALYTYRAIPKQGCDVFLLGKVTNWGKYNFIAGDANVYFEDQFIGTTYLSSTQHKDTLEISLGKDESIIVNRERAYQMERKRSFGNKKRANRAWKITVKNNKSKDINIEILDQIPISVNDQIIVTPLEMSKGTYDKETGEVEWNFSLDAQKSKEIILQYEVEYPAKGYEPLDVN